MKNHPHVASSLQWLLANGHAALGTSNPNHNVHVAYIHIYILKRCVRCMAIEHYYHHSLFKPSLVPPMHGLLLQSVHVQGHHEPIFEGIRFYSLHLPQNPNTRFLYSTWISYFLNFKFRDLSVNIRQCFCFVLGPLHVIDILWDFYFTLFIVFRDSSVNIRQYFCFALGPLHIINILVYFGGFQGLKLWPCILPFVYSFLILCCTKENKFLVEVRNLVMQSFIC